MNIKNIRMKTLRKLRRIQSYLSLCGLVFSFFFITKEAESQTLHAFLVADTYDSSIGVTCQADLDSMNAKMAQVAQAIGYVYNPVLIQADRFGRNSMESALSNLTCSPEDVIFCLYAGHGFTTEGRPNIFPLLLLKDDNTYGLEDLHDQLKRKNPKLCVTLGDCCSQLLPQAIPPMHRPLFRGIDVKSDVTILSQLFTETQGDVLICSTKSGELAASIPVYGGLYTRSWLEALGFAESGNTEVDWESLLQDSKSRLALFSTSPFFGNTMSTLRQTPHWRINTRTVNPANQNTVNFAELNEFLNRLADESQSYENRSVLRNKKKDSFFLPDAQIKLYVDNPERPVETQPLSRFLSRLINNGPQIQQVNVVQRLSVVDTEGKYRLLTVQEVR